MAWDRRGRNRMVIVVVGFKTTYANSA
jgi:hypothetical protein